MMVASTMVPSLSRSSWDSRWALNLIQKALPQLVFFQKMPEIQDGGLIGQGA